jgi:hypothetical protein
MPSLVRIRVIEGRDLPAAEGDFLDCYVDIQLGSEQQRTETIRKSLDPYWDEEFRFEIVDDAILQNCPVELKVFDHGSINDLYAVDFLGAVYVDLTPLLVRATGDSDKDLTIQGWLPLFNTFRGARGEINVVIKLSFIDNDNPFRDSSAGVHFFSSSTLSNSSFIVHEVRVSALLCCDVLCCVMLYCTVLCCAVLCCTVLCCLSRLVSVCCLHPSSDDITSCTTLRAWVYPRLL